MTTGHANGGWMNADQLESDAAAYLAACNVGRPEDAAVAAEGHDRDAFRAALVAAEWPTPPAAEARGDAEKRTEN